jgi:hypothetical protein
VGMGADWLGNCYNCLLLVGSAVGSMCGVD